MAAPPIVVQGCASRALGYYHSPLRASGLARYAAREIQVDAEVLLPALKSEKKTLFSCQGLDRYYYIFQIHWPSSGTAMSAVRHGLRGGSSKRGVYENLNCS